MKTVSTIFNSVCHLVNTKFVDDMAFDAVVHKIDSVPHRVFIIKLVNENIFLKCISRIDISDLNENDIVRISGKPRINKSGLICITATYLYKTDIESKMAACINKLTSHCNILEEKKVLKQASIRHLPKVVENIGIIFVENKVNNLANTAAKQNMINLLQSFKGNIYILNIGVENLESGLYEALELYKRYYNIHIVSLVTIGLNIDSIMDLNSTNIIKFLINEKRYPYFTFYSDYLSNVQPIKSFSNKFFATLKENTDFLISANLSYREDLHKTLIQTRQKISNMLLTLENYAMKTEIVLIDTFEKFINYNPVEEAKKLALTDLDKIDKSLNDFTNTLLERVITNLDLNAIMTLPNSLKNETKVNLESGILGINDENKISLNDVPQMEIINNDKTTIVIPHDDNFQG